MIFLSLLILIVAKALPLLNKNISSIYFTRISAIIFIYAGVLSLNTLYIQSIGSGIGIYSGLFHITQVSQLIEFFLLIIGSFILIAWPILPKKMLNYNYSTDYSLIVLFSTLGSSLLISSSDLVSMYLSIELQSFGLYVLSTLYRDSESSTSAGLKYFLLGGLSSCIILLGSGIIYSYTGLTKFDSLYSLISVSDYNYIIQGLSLGLILIIVGFLFKISAAPLHNWSPDVYDQTPTIVTIWLTVMPKIAIIMLLLELHTQIEFIGGLTNITINTNGYAELLNTLTSISTSTIEPNNIINNISVSILSPLNKIMAENSIYLLKNLLLISSLLSLIIGTVVGLIQTKIKRLLAYSTISHIGFMLLVLAINTEQSIDSLLFYLIQYTITNLNVFLILIGLSYVINHSLAKGGYLENQIKLFKNNPNPIQDIKYLSQLNGIFFSQPLLSVSLSICLFSMAGIPPLIGFFSKQFVLYSAVQNGYYFLSVVAIIASVISASYYLKIIKNLHDDSLINDNIMKEKELDTSNFIQYSQEEKISDKNTINIINIEKEIKNETSETLLSNFHSFLISSLTLSILLFILKPSLILNSTQLLSLSIFNF